jgi:hypothetical protein
MSREVQQAQGVLERRRRPAKAAKQSRRAKQLPSSNGAAEAAREAFRLRCAAFDQEALSKKTYLTIPELCAYGCFDSENAAYLFLSRNPQVPKCRRGRVVFVRRRDYDRFVQPSHVSGDPHAR